MLSIFNDPRFWLVPVASVPIGMAAFLLFASLFTWLAARDPAWARRWRIQNPRGAGSLSQEDAARRGILVPGRNMVRQSLRVWLLNNLWMLGGAALSWPLMAQTGIHGGALPPWWAVALQLLLFVYLDDFLYYWMHRAMHTRFLLKHVHGVHHRVLTPWAITGNYMHPAEYLLTGTLVFIGPALIGAHIMVLWLWVIVRQWEAAEGHSGYDLPWTPTHWLPFSHGALHHDFHHARVRGNYAGFLPLWDRIFGTMVRDYDASLHDWHARSDMKNR